MPAAIHHAVGRKAISPWDPGQNRSFISVLQLPGASHHSRESAVGRIIVDKALLLRIPYELLLEPDGDVAYLADYVALDGVVYVGNRFGPAFDAV